MSDDRTDRIEQLLGAAMPEFARGGLAGARVDAIARAAGMNKRLLYHYVGDKEALFDAALQRAIERVQAAPDECLTNEWRMVCHGVAEGRAPDLSGILDRFDPQARATSIGLVMLASLLPDLADRLLGNGGGESGRAVALKRSLQVLSSASQAPKPRLKLRPDLRSGPTGS